jgi:hypothetical protein
MYKCVCVCVCMRYICTLMYIYSHIHVNLRFTITWDCVLLLTFLGGWMCTYMYVCVYIYVYIYICIYTYKTLYYRRNVAPLPSISRSSMYYLEGSAAASLSFSSVNSAGVPTICCQKIAGKYLCTCEYICMCMHICPSICCQKIAGKYLCTCSSYICYVVDLIACVRSTFGDDGILSSFFSFILTSNKDQSIHVSTCVCVCTYVRQYASGKWQSKFIHILIYTYTHIYIGGCLYIYIYINIYLYMHVCILCIYVEIGG